MLIGVLALQGDYGTHAEALTEIGVKSVEIRRPEDAGFLNPKAPRYTRKQEAGEGKPLIRESDREAVLRPVPDGLILPGGESSTIDLLGRRYGLDFLMSAFAASGKILFGTCAGAIWLGKGEHHKVTPLGLIDVDVERNAYGRQLDSFIEPINVRGLDEPFEAVFIRAPKFTRIGPGVEVIAEHNGDPVLVRQRNIWLATFHPERTADRRLHQMIFQQM
ncbi:MAG TPA: pyridoxal 5'-phosphate synthase glutaminase subunit PdxT [Bacteroidetes bacterium]|nr:glutamine amidotransferase subunit PdxT [bacterium BMS3Bbin04]HDO65841.1 pyridoxal 5'-phosphate synthase glutaminase subunit PdxT [Bacteroidota bacterium]HEX04966.1 pyridoxal 5'-phosphate synthase glutaminase subunit PdxT [Bacteroidota bacterium]